MDSWSNILKYVPSAVLWLAHNPLEAEAYVLKEVSIVYIGMLIDLLGCGKRSSR